MATPDVPMSGREPRRVPAGEAPPEDKGGSTQGEDESALTSIAHVKAFLARLGQNRTLSPGLARALERTTQQHVIDYFVHKGGIRRLLSAADAPKTQDEDRLRALCFLERAAKGHCVQTSPRYAGRIGTGLRLSRISSNSKVQEAARTLWTRVAAIRSPSNNSDPPKPFDAAMARVTGGNGGVSRGEEMRFLHLIRSDFCMGPGGEINRRKALEILTFTRGPALLRLAACGLRKTLQGWPADDAATTVLQRAAALDAPSLSSIGQMARGTDHDLLIEEQARREALDLVRPVTGSQKRLKRYAGVSFPDANLHRRCKSLPKRRDSTSALGALESAVVRMRMRGWNTAAQTPLRQRRRRGQKTLPRVTYPTFLNDTLAAIPARDAVISLGSSTHPPRSVDYTHADSQNASSSSLTVLRARASSLPGVTWAAVQDAWRAAAVSPDGKTRAHLGYFDSEDDAWRAVIAFHATQDWPLQSPAPHPVSRGKATAAAEEKSPWEFENFRLPGVSWDSNRGAWAAVAGHRGTKLRLGWFRSRRRAWEAVCKKRKQLRWPAKSPAAQATPASGALMKAVGRKTERPSGWSKGQSTDPDLAHDVQEFVPWRVFRVVFGDDASAWRVVNDKLTRQYGVRHSDSGNDSADEKSKNGARRAMGSSKSAPEPAPLSDVAIQEPPPSTATTPPSKEEEPQAMSVDELYAALEGFESHLTNPQSALVWLMDAAPTKFRRLLVPPRNRLPPSVQGSGGYAAAFERLQLTVTDADKTGSRWHRWYAAPHLDLLRIQQAIRRRWDEAAPLRQTRATPAPANAPPTPTRSNPKASPVKSPSKRVRVTAPPIQFLATPRRKRRAPVLYKPDDGSGEPKRSKLTSPSSVGPGTAGQSTPKASRQQPPAVAALQGQWVSTYAGVATDPTVNGLSVVFKNGVKFKLSHRRGVVVLDGTWTLDADESTLDVCFWRHENPDVEPVIWTRQDAAASPTRTHSDESLAPPLAADFALERAKIPSREHKTPGFKRAITPPAKLTTSSSVPRQQRPRTVQPTRKRKRRAPQSESLENDVESVARLLAGFGEAVRPSAQGDSSDSGDVAESHQPLNDRNSRAGLGAHRDPDAPSEARGRSAEEVTFKCFGCSARVAVRPGDETVECAQCGNTSMAYLYKSRAAAAEQLHRRTEAIYTESRQRKGFRGYNRFGHVEWVGEDKRSQSDAPQ